MLCVLRIVFVLCWLALSLGVIPTGQIKIYGRSDYLYGAPGTFSSSLPTYTSYGRLLEPTNEADGCNPIITKLAKSVQYYLLVSRGTCSFQDKQSAAYYAGAKGVIVYNTLEGIYQGQNYSSETDYECENGEGYISKVTYPVYSDEMDASMPVSCTGNSKCDSSKCVVTNYTDATLGTKVCCAWDLYLTMGADEDDGSDPVDLPAVFIRMQDMDYINGLPDSNIEIQLYQRPLYWEFVSILMLYAMAVGTLTYGAYRVAMTDRKEFNDQEIEEMKRKKKNAMHRPNLGASSNYSDVSGSDVEQQQQHDNSNYQQTTGGEESDWENQFTQSNPLLNSHGKGEPTAKDVTERESVKPKKGNREEETVELRSEHAIAFVICSSLFLILLYMIDVTFIVSMIYLLLAALACSVVCVYPFYRNMIRFVLMISRSISLFDAVDFMDGIKSWKRHIPSTAAFVTSLIVVAIWYIYRETDWAWVLQDFMGICVCLLCLETILIPNLKVATALLCLAFLYDIFFVFISPYIFSSSVMEEVATGSSNSNSDPNYCEKYPDDQTYCADNSLPMLLQVPTLFTYLDGDSILGLGDVVLPGLLAVWAARHDIRQFGKLDFDQFARGYFPLAIKMYCVGLLLADVAVMVFSTGQPALLYIVPCVLGSILYRSFQNDTLATLWTDLPTMKLVALPIQSDEQVSLLSNANVVVAEAIWNKTLEHVTILDESHISRIPTSANSLLVEHQSGILKDKNASLGLSTSSTDTSSIAKATASKFIRQKDKKKNLTEAVATVTTTGSSSNSSNNSTILDRQEDSYHSFPAGQNKSNNNLIQDDDGEPI